MWCTVGVAPGNATFLWNGDTFGLRNVTYLCTARRQSQRGRTGSPPAVTAVRASGTYTSCPEDGMSRFLSHECFMRFRPPPLLQKPPTPGCRARTLQAAAPMPPRATPHRGQRDRHADGIQWRAATRSPVAGVHGQDGQQRGGVQHARLRSDARSATSMRARAWRPCMRGKGAATGLQRAHV
jgi:hypothetical protein